MEELNNISSEQNEFNMDWDKTFDDEWHKEWIDKIEKEMHKQKEYNLTKASKLAESLFEDKHGDINEFIEKLRKDWVNEEEIAKNLIIQWCSWDEFMKSSIDESVKLFVENNRKEVIKNQQNYIFRFKDEEDLAEKYFDVLRDCLTKNISFLDAVKYIPLKRPITVEDIKNIKNALDNPDNNANVDLSGEILPDLDWSESREVFKYLNFDDNTFSKTSKEHLPEWFDPKEIFEKGKSIGLWIDDVHKMWYTWKWVSVAICDWQLKPHKDIQTKEYTVEKNANNSNDYFHASAVSSILTWKQTWIAPDANLYFYAEKQNNMEKDGGQDLASSLNKILQKNEELSDDKKIRVISISWPLYWWKETKELVKKLEKSWVWVLYSGEFWKSFWYLEKKDPMWDSNDLQNYQHYLWYYRDYLWYRHFPRKSEALFVNSGDRTVASPENDEAYRHDTQASASWAIPVVAWYYALACQADPSMTPKKFKRLANETAHEIDSTIRKRNGDRSLDTKKIKVIDIKALIQKIEEEKNKE